MALILVVDDEPDIQRLLTEILNLEGHAVHTAADGLEALHRVRRQCFDLALVDIWLPGLNGIELLNRLKHARPTLPVIIITCRPAYMTCVLALRMGACDYVEKPFNVANLRATVQRALAKENQPAEQEEHWNATQLACALPWLAGSEQICDSLSMREKQVLARLASGQTNDEIARDMRLSIKTVGHHVSHILVKLGVRSRTEAAVWATEVGIREQSYDRENTPDGDRGNAIDKSGENTPDKNGGNAR